VLADQVESNVTDQARLAVRHDQDGITLAGRGDLAAALASFDAAIKLCPTFAEAWFHRGLALLQLHQAPLAYESFAQAVFLAPNYLDALAQMKALAPAVGRSPEIVTPWADGSPAGALRRAYYRFRARSSADERYDESVAPSEEPLRRALESNPRSAEIADELGFMLQFQGRRVEAELFFRYALMIAPWMGRAAVHLCVLLEMTQRWEEAEGLAAAAMAAGSTDIRLPGLALWSAIFVADWSHYHNWRQRTLDAMRKDTRAATGHGMLFTDDPELLYREACGHSGAYEKSILPLAADFRRSGDRPITLGYISADFHDHPVARLTAELFELHDRTRFRVHGYGLVDVPGSEIGARIRRAFDKYTDLSALTAAASAARIAEDGVDILIDLTGNMIHGPKSIIARRPAPVQVHYLGTPGTSGSRRMDYVIVDKIIVPDEQRQWFTEALVYMPDCHQVNDRKRAVGEPRARSAYGLPDRGVVYCSFNETKKITPEVFDAWLRILARVPGSVLWLAAQRKATVNNLRLRAAANHIDPDRLVFAERVPAHADHMARYLICDLYLDTLIYNGHTTASDALWGGCPVLTTLGASYQTRVAASLLHAVGLPELVASSLESYEDLAVRVGLDAGFRAALRGKAEANRASCALFDTPRFTRGLEWAFEHMWDTYAAGRAPAAFDVPGEPREPA
jgi:predicted O-linked N-acetylglucosamine transferase (SPINDLY family)